MTTKRFYYPIFGIIIFIGLFGWILPSKAARTEFFQQLGTNNHSTTNNSTTRGGTRERPSQVPTLAEETQHFGKELKMAVVVGINDYPSSSGLRSLRYAKADAEALAQALKQAGYGVQLLTNSNATKGSILNTLSNIGKVLEPQKGTVIFAFAGHGFRDRNGNNYLAPFEASADYIEDTGLSLKKVEATLVASGARRRILLIDACRNDPKPGSRSGATVMDTFTQQPLFRDADGTRILFSTRAGGFSWENPELGHGIFTYFILEGLKGKAANNQGLITFRGLSDYVQKAVPKWAIEKGYAQRPYDAGEGSGWFLVTQTVPIVDCDRLAASSSSSNSGIVGVAFDKIDAPKAIIACQTAVKSWPQVVRFMFQLGRSHDAAKDYQNALIWYRKAAEQGHASAQSNLGTMYRNGRGVTQDDQQAVAWYRKAAAQGNAYAQNNLGWMYQNGRGVTQDDQQAVAWYQKAAAQGNAFAQNNLGLMYDKEAARKLAEQQQREEAEFRRHEKQEGLWEEWAQRGWGLSAQEIQSTQTALSKNVEATSLDFSTFLELAALAYEDQLNDGILLDNNIPFVRGFRPRKNPGPQKDIKLPVERRNIHKISDFANNYPHINFSAKLALCGIHRLDYCNIGNELFRQRLKEKIEKYAPHFLIEDINNIGKPIIYLKNLNDGKYIMYVSTSFPAGAEKIIIATIIDENLNVDHLFGIEVSSRSGLRIGAGPDLVLLGNVIIGDASLIQNTLIISLDTYLRCAGKKRKLGFLIRFSLSDYQVKWVSPFNTGSVFAVAGNRIYAADGGSCEKDYLYAIDTETGTVVARDVVPTAFNWLHVEDGRLFGQTYNGGFVYRLK